MEFVIACKTALKHFRREYGDTGFYSIKDIGDRWVFFGGDKKGRVFYGKMGITIEKNGDKIDYFYLPDKHNFELLDHAKDVEVPEKFRIK